MVVGNMLLCSVISITLFATVNSYGGINVGKSRTKSLIHDSDNNLSSRRLREFVKSSKAPALQSQDKTTKIQPQDFGTSVPGFWQSNYYGDFDCFGAQITTVAWPTDTCIDSMLGMDIAPPEYLSYTFTLDESCNMKIVGYYDRACFEYQGTTDIAGSPDPVCSNIDTTNDDGLANAWHSSSSFCTLGTSPTMGGMETVMQFNVYKELPQCEALATPYVSIFDATNVCVHSQNPAAENEQTADWVMLTCDSTDEIESFFTTEGCAAEDYVTATVTPIPNGCFTIEDDEGSEMGTALVSCGLITVQPTSRPSSHPTSRPTSRPTAVPIVIPQEPGTPTLMPVEEPTGSGSSTTRKPTRKPTAKPTAIPTFKGNTTSKGVTHKIKSNKISAGAIVGIVIGVVAFLVLGRLLLGVAVPEVNNYTFYGAKKNKVTRVKFADEEEQEYDDRDKSKGMAAQNEDYDDTV